MLQRQGLECRVGVWFGRKGAWKGNHTGKRGTGQEKDKALVKHAEECGRIREGGGEA